MAKILNSKAIDYAALNAPYIGKTLKVKSCTRNSSLNSDGIQKSGYHITFASKANANLRTTVRGYSMSKMKVNSFCTMNESGFLVPMVDVNDYIDIDKADKTFDKVLSKIDFS